ncbi:MAG: methyltransferase domain-containing protein [Oscillatoria sp. PMC 1051.18]|uniref:methyltransferase domain-containing protein n=1 Tax=Oscillatoria salina TaxID=331517 RepID=UPI0013B74D59|nr:methyltransferase domain-containing protein [Oscillatoria salina]MBZ8179957.1 methyltransferase domain-containing protein [Oscillatoria salina IIICB1]MEC4895248.1 methyltransferase domain-containing protein [Oscillatoria sp. PMC 1050.18]MEC5029570.1 methyltransferase domain-containing protein [Oscillatoria sp. PMC 1051.18]NET86818.1 methyltransferase domain-containing protein [Kamptonema sp. SIO1D9]
MTSTLYQQIQQFYDASSGLWEQVWGEHMHHGYYGKNGNYKLNRRQAQINLIEELLIWAGLTNLEKPPQTIVDLGCGIGGSTLYLAQKYRATATGITLSPVQAARAKERAIEAGLESRVQFQVADAQNTPFEDNSFDLVWSLESGEHMPDKEKFVRECDRILKPGGTFIMATWCHRPTNSLAGELTENEKRHLEKIYQVYCLPYVISLPEYEEIARNCNFKNIRSDDWSEAVAPFWNVVIDSAFDPQAIIGLISSGWQTVEAALSLGLMSRGYERGLIRFGLLCATK